MKPWSIQIFYEARDDSGKPLRATAVFQTEAPDVRAAYAVAEALFNGGEKMGAILPGHHARFP